MQALSAVVVDDHRLTAFALADSLRQRSIDVRAVAHDVAEALKVIKESTPDVVVTDLDLGPGPSGIDFARKLRSSYPRTGVVVLTAYEDPRLFHADIPPIPREVVYLVKQQIKQLDELAEAVGLAVAYARGAIKTSESQVRFPLTQSQAALLRLVAQGLTNQSIAETLKLTEDSVAKAINRLAKKLGVSSATGTNVRVGLTQRYFDFVGYQREA